MKRGTHGIAVVSIAAIVAAIRIEIIRDASAVVIAGTQPGVIYASDRPESAGYPRLFKNLLHSMKRDARHSGRKY